MTSSSRWRAGSAVTKPSVRPSASALEKYVQWLKQQAIVSEFGKIDYVHSGKQKKLLDLQGSGRVRKGYDSKQE